MVDCLQGHMAANLSTDNQVPFNFVSAIITMVLVFLFMFYGVKGLEQVP